mgnify:FL=1|jgi:hypothetical protein
MHIDIGDLVTIKQNNRINSSNNHNLGIVIKKSRPVQGLEKSTHTSRMLSSYSPVFYVYSEDGDYKGPFQRSELLLQQTYSSSKEAITMNE